MASKLQTAINATEVALGSLSPDTTIADRIKFKRFKGTDIIDALNDSGDATSVRPKEVVSLKVNPQSMRKTRQRIIEKVQTNAPDSFVVFDWGTDLTVFDLSGDTGNLLPEVIQSGFDPVRGFYNNINNKSIFNTVSKIRGKPPARNISPDLGDGEVSDFYQRGGAQGFGKAVFNNLSYFDIIDMSAKYRQFKKLETMFEQFDADRDVLTMEFGPHAYRGYFMDFSFTIDANDAWHWKYDIQFVALNDLTAKKRRSDREFNKDAIEDE